MATVEAQINLRFSKMRVAFRALDFDRSGSIGREELARGLRSWNLFNEADPNPKPKPKPKP